ncbi:unnamed protein product [Nippostrongylus brasiliensis]|uniref:Major sperm protein (inferred by orthology to a C. elegans protein) n=1 Tax=Nippostrongylus brasiliensis TaxID=27835 RepID=A0A0N4YEK5_NIPBR|nr:hypothetical protein Q1695_002432 [Nippostrongylus brasiliensis]VDL78731.1 unnamed protein product [Nippostrongylus brasiliensis]
MAATEKLDISPRELKWEFEEGQQVFKVTNNTNSRFAVKVKCTDNTLYTVSPVSDFVNAGQCITIAVVRAKGPLKKDKLVICTKQVTEEEKDALEAFKSGQQDTEIIEMDQRVRT